MQVRHRRTIDPGRVVYLHLGEGELNAMQNHLGAVDLDYRHPDGSILFSSLTFNLSAVRTGLVGLNGVGKSTLLDLLVGRKSPSAGSITRSGQIAYLPQTIRFDNQATVAEALQLTDELKALERVLRGDGTS